MRYIYGPLKSRRLGFSLGVSPIPYKTCNFDCLYCQLGKAKVLELERQEYIKVDEILDELRSWLENNPQEALSLNYITISGSGEPTLNIKIGQLIAEIKKITSIPIAVITNSSLLNIASVRSELLPADLIVPSLDAVTQSLFVKINNPSQEIKIGQIIEGLLNLRKEYRGKIWLEIMLVKGVNDKPAHIRALKEIVDKLNPDKIQLNSPVRFTAYGNTIALDKKKLLKIQSVLGERCEII